MEDQAVAFPSTSKLKLLDNKHKQQKKLDTEFLNFDRVAMPAAVSTTEDDIDYTDIEEKCVYFIFYKQSGPTQPHRYQVQYEESFDNTIVVDGIPVIDKSKLDKLLAKIAKEFSRQGAPIKPGDIFVPWDDSTGKSKGYSYFLSCFPQSQTSFQVHFR